MNVLESLASSLSRSGEQELAADQAGVAAARGTRYSRPDMAIVVARHEGSSP